MVPAMMEELLFDDILFGDRARDEHRQFRRVLQLLGVDALEAEDLLAETLDGADGRGWVREVILDELPDALRSEILEAPSADLAATLVSGVLASPAPGRVEPEDLYELSPLPNWCFQRDPQIVLGSGVVFGSMAADARHREALLARAVFRFHPTLRAAEVLLDPIESTPDHPHYAAPTRPSLEGGDVLVLSTDVIAAGWSWSRSRAAARSCTSTRSSRRSTAMPACSIRRSCSPEAGPRKRACPSSTCTRRRRASRSAPTSCPLYDRNLGTADELARCGFRVVETEALLLGRDEVDLDEEGRVCILVPSHEISRARGGPHCLAHPLLRDDV
jgi:arginine deiminase